MAANRSDQILEAALGLPTRYSLRIARDLLDSVDDEAGRDADWEASWTAELERRSQEMRDGTVQLLDAETVFAELEAELKGPPAGKVTKARRNAPRRQRPR
jgi:putative addiction module component (TIGR02574 family)